MARPPKPTAILKLTGAYRPDRHGHRKELKVPAGAPAAPAHLSAEAKAEWARLVPNLMKAGLLSELDRGTLACYCIAWADSVMAQKHIEAEGSIITAPSGYPVQSPWLAIKNKSMEMLSKFGAALGLSVAARTRIECGPATKGDETSEAINDYFGTKKGTA